MRRRVRKARLQARQTRRVFGVPPPVEKVQRLVLAVLCWGNFAAAVPKMRSSELPGYPTTPCGAAVFNFHDGGTQVGKHGDLAVETSAGGGYV